MIEIRKQMEDVELKLKFPDVQSISTVFIEKWLLQNKQFNEIYDLLADTNHREFD